jgi:hypothetical protein
MCGGAGEDVVETPGFIREFDEDAYDIGLDKDLPRSSQCNRLAFNFLRHQWSYWVYILLLRLLTTSPSVGPLDKPTSKTSFPWLSPEGRSSSK